MKHRYILAAVLLGALAALQGCSRKGSSEQGAGGQPANSIQVKGSDTMVNLGQAWAEAYGKSYPNVTVSVTGGGSGTGIAALISGSTDIAESSREMEPSELAEAKSSGREAKQFVVARDGVSVIVNPSNKIGRLTIDQLSGIYTGKLTNWKQVGGQDARITVISRDTSSGTHVFFRDHVLRKGNAKGPEEYGKSVLLLPSSQAIAQEVSSNADAIGYVGMGYVTPGKQKTVAVAKTESGPYVEPTPANVVNKSYPIARPLYFYTPGEPKGKVKEFIDFVLSKDGQAIVSKLEFVPVSTPK